MNELSLEKKTLILSSLVEGCSIRSIERMTGVHRDTIMRLLVSAGEQAQEIMWREINNLRVQRLQVDELWAYVGKKQKQVRRTERDNPEIGDQYIFTAIDADTKLIPAFRLGKRTGKLARSFMVELSSRIDTKFQLTTDSFQGYFEAVDRVWGKEIDYAQLHKQYSGEPAKDSEHRYSPPNIIRVDIKPMIGEPDRRHISTSYIERSNLSVRMSLRRLTRLTNAFSKKWHNLWMALALFFYHYNFQRIHQSLRVTPAMEARITDHIWSWRELLNYQQTINVAA